MKKKLTEITIYSLIIVGILYSFAFTQAIWDFDLFPKDLEKYIFGLFASFGILVFFLFLASFIYELQEIRKILISKNDNETES